MVCSHSLQTYLAATAPRERKTPSSFRFSFLSDTQIIQSAEPIGSVLPKNIVGGTPDPQSPQVASNIEEFGPTQDNSHPRTEPVGSSSPEDTVSNSPDTGIFAIKRIDNYYSTSI